MHNHSSRSLATSTSHSSPASQPTALSPATHNSAATLSHGSRQNQAFPHVSPASLSQYGPRPQPVPTPDQITVKLSQSTIRYDNQNFYDPESLSHTTSVPDSSVPLLPSPSFLTTPHTSTLHGQHDNTPLASNVLSSDDRYAAPHYQTSPSFSHSTTTPPNQSHFPVPNMIHPIRSSSPSSNAPSSLGSHTESAYLNVLQRQIESLQREQLRREADSQRKEVENKLLLQQMLQTQQKMDTIFDTVTRLQTENRNLQE